MTDEARFIDMLQKNEKLMEILDFIDQLNLKDYYLAAGCVFQTIWNLQEQQEPMAHIHDIDLVYYDLTNSYDTAKARDKELETLLNQRFALEFDVHNEAYMHQWKGRNLKPYQSTEDAMCRWIATVHAVGIRGNRQQLTLFAPFGLTDIFERHIRPIYHLDNSKSLYDAKCAKWQARFSDLKIERWSNK
ncbi:MAG: nucleotidyltransferase family protein [Lactococcus sp.]